MTFDLAPILDRLGVEYDPDKAGNQKVNCPVHDDIISKRPVAMPGRNGTRSATGTSRRLA